MQTTPSGDRRFHQPRLASPTAGQLTMNNVIQQTFFLVNSGLPETRGQIAGAAPLFSSRWSAMVCGQCRGGSALEQLAFWATGCRTVPAASIYRTVDGRRRIVAQRRSATMLARHRSNRATGDRWHRRAAASPSTRHRAVPASFGYAALTVTMPETCRSGDRRLIGDRPVL